MSYPRKGSFTRGVIKISLNINPVFASLTDDQKNALIDQAAQRVCDLRNSLGLETYQTDTTQDASAMALANHVGLWAARPLTGVPTGWLYYATDKQAQYTFDSVVGGYV